LVVAALHSGFEPGEDVDASLLDGPQVGVGVVTGTEQDEVS
jgi:hypothetical protein